MASACKEEPSNPVPEQFPVGLKVLVVDDDVLCLRILEQMLRKCMYSVTPCSQAAVALNLLRERKHFFDIVLIDVHVPDMDGLKLLELVGAEMDLPVIMMSGDDRTSLVMRGIRLGACDYLIKPMRTEELKNIWQHVVRKRCNVSEERELSGSLEDNDQQKHGTVESEYASCVKQASMHGGLPGAGLASPATVSSGSPKTNNALDMQVSASGFGEAGQLSAALVPNVGTLQHPYNAISCQMLDQGMLWNTAFVGGGTSIPSHFAVKEIRVPITSGNQEKMCGQNTGDKVKQELSKNSSENAEGGTLLLQLLFTIRITFLVFFFFLVVFYLAHPQCISVSSHFPF